MKIYFKLLILLFLFANLSADFVRLEGGMRLFYNSKFITEGTIKDTDIGKNTLNFNNHSIAYQFWSFIKHPTPFLPNLRFSYEAYKSNAKALKDLSFLGSNFKSKAKAKLSINALDLITYYNMVDNISFMTIDLGLGLRKFSGALNIGNQTQNINFYLPGLFSRFRFFSDALGLGSEIVFKGLPLDKYNFQDLILVADYRILDMPGFVLALEAGYKMQKLKLKIAKDYNFDYQNNNIFLGLTGRF